jgi:hypothetical protein
VHLRPADVLPAEPADERPAVDGIEADAQDLEAVGGVLPVQALESRQLGETRRAPGRPEVHEHHPPRERVGRPAAPVHVPGVERRDGRRQVAPVEGRRLPRRTRRQGPAGEDAGRGGRDGEGAHRH